MADKPNTEKKTKVKAAKPEGAAAEKVVLPAETKASAPSPAKSLKKGKLPPKNKSRLPRLEKKAQKKAAGQL